MARKSDAPRSRVTGLYLRRKGGELELKGGLLRIWPLGPFFSSELELKGGAGAIYALPSSSALRSAVQ
jgi:hypothetical protein